MLSIRPCVQRQKEVDAGWSTRTQLPLFHVRMEIMLPSFNFAARPAHLEHRCWCTTTCCRDEQCMHHTYCWNKGEIKWSNIYAEIKVNERRIIAVYYKYRTTIYRSGYARTSTVQVPIDLYILAEILLHVSLKNPRAKFYRLVHQRAVAVGWQIIVHR